LVFKGRAYHPRKKKRQFIKSLRRYQKHRKVFFLWFGTCAKRRPPVARGGFDCGWTDAHVGGEAGGAGCGVLAGEVRAVEAEFCCTVWEVMGV
jgi:hypothetical protein